MTKPSLLPVPSLSTQDGDDDGNTGCQSHAPGACCDVCCYDYTRVRRYPIRCKYCRKYFCRTCLARSLTHTESACPYCSRKFDTNFIRVHCSCRAMAALRAKSFKAEIRRLPKTREALFAEIGTADNINGISCACGSVAIIDNSLLSGRAKCATCFRVYCATCETETDPTIIHSCDTRVIASLNAIVSKKCPRCMTRISRDADNGCDQMYCVVCQTTWSWKTRRIVDSKETHNPHYFDTSVNEARNRSIDNLVKKNINATVVVALLKSFRKAIDSRLGRETEAWETFCFNARVKYLNGLVSFAKWKSLWFDEYAIHERNTRLIDTIDAVIASFEMNEKVDESTSYLCESCYGCESQNKTDYVYSLELADSELKRMHAPCKRTSKQHLDDTYEVNETRIKIPYAPEWLSS
jgi:hypothetical protein